MNDPVSHHIKIALFCGGRGSATIIHELLHWPNIDLTLIVNAYDDGLSTGALREFVTHMLGPSDFRKNLSYLLNPFSEGQYALKNVLEFRLPITIDSKKMNHFLDFIKIEPLHSLLSQLNHELLTTVRHYVNAFFNYANANALEFDYRDCALGNIIFAGAYLEKNYNFNAATQAMSQLVSSRAVLLNVSQGENRVLVALKEDGELLANEAQIVSSQSSIPIRHIYLLTHPVLPSEWSKLADKTIEEKDTWLRNQEVFPSISPEAEKALKEADIILFGPGTQHSSLLPSYRIASESLQRSNASVKALIMNLEPDHDIQSLSTKDILDRALFYMNDQENTSQVMTHVLIDTGCTLNAEKCKLSLNDTDHYKNAEIVYGNFANSFKEKKVHNGQAVVKNILAQWEKSVTYQGDHASVNIFVDIDKRSLAISALHEEFLEMDWNNHFSKVELAVNQSKGHSVQMSSMHRIVIENREGDFPEIDYFSDWLHHKKSEYLVLLTGDGEYRFRDVMLGIKLLEQSHFGAVFGSRNQSRLQFKASLQSAYGEKKLLSQLSVAAAFLMSIIFSLRYGIIFSDPLTGFRIFKRSRILHRIKKLSTSKKATPITIAKYLIMHNVEIAELPVNYRTFSGFTDPKWRIRRGIKNLISLFTRYQS